MIEINSEFKILQFKLKQSDQVEITVNGISMYPNLIEKDVITVAPCEKYANGDVLAFCYMDTEIIVHRLLLHTNSKYFCKGDNTFRLEEVNKNQILGKVKKVVRGAHEFILHSAEEAFIQHSLAIYREFSKNEFNKEKTMLSDIYKEYFKKYLCLTV